MNDSKTKKKLLLILVMLVGVVAIYFIFSSDTSGGQSSGINKELPAPESEELPEKEKAYIDDALNNLSLSGSMDDTEVELLMLDSVSTQIGALDAALERSKADQEAVQKNVTNLAATISSAKVNAAQREEKERVQAEKEELARKLREKEAELHTATVTARLNAILVSRDTILQAVNGEDSEASKPIATDAVHPIPDNQGDIATTLGSRVRRTGGFYGMSNTPVQRNGIQACVYGQQVIGDGQHLRIRLLEPMMVSGQVVSAGSVLVGMCKIGADRLRVSIASIEYGGIITRVALEVYDSDGQQGLYVPGSMEMEAGREIGADIANSVGSTAASQMSMFTQQSASEQIKADIGRGVVQGTFKFLGRKLQEVKVTVQDKHKIFLVSQK
ncbi:MAG: conjugative transposon protein TraM [Prevotellaceae bacterium]|jgi:conjugative transposon TraM protein|nr:conjugative transposon protein TraM [Prevotellaceae bacterium]